MNTPLPCIWDGEAFKPLTRFAKQCDKEFVVGQRYAVEVAQERSMRSHNHFFAAIATAWENLPEEMAPHFASPEHLRKYALIRTGYHHERSIVCASAREAERVAAFVKPMDQFAVVIVADAVVKVFTAESQKIKAMGKARFQQSKTDVLEFLAARIGVQRHALEKAA